MGAGSVLNLLQDFIAEIEERDDQGRRTGETPLIFPRYHQLRAVRRPARDARQAGPGERYLVQHSAGSGKSISIAVLAHLLEGDDATLGLLRHTPFADEPPEQVRVARYRYRYTTPEERAETGNWWGRERVGVYLPPISLEELRQGTARPRGRYV